MNKDLIVGDADALIALYLKNDALHGKIIVLIEKILEKNIRIIFPNTAIAESITALHRKLSNSSAAALLNEHYKEGKFEVEYISEETMQKASELYNPDSSKQNTFFDAIVASAAKNLDTNIILSFDKFYKKLGFELASSVFA